MALASWDSTLPQVFEIEGFDEVDQDMIVTFQPRSGKAKTRPRFLSTFRSIKGNVTIDTVGKSTFENWYYNTIHSGQDKFLSQLASANGIIETYLFDPRRPTAYDLSQHGDNYILTLQVLVVPQ